MRVQLPDARPIRHEMRHQWVAHGDSKDMARHFYAKRFMRSDEDSYQITGGKMYDGCGELRRVQEFGRAPDYRPEVHNYWTTGGEWIYDWLAGRYMVLQIKLGRPANIVEVLERLTPDYFTPANVRRLGR